jgi:hypothetical protein
VELRNKKVRHKLFEIAYLTFKIYIRNMKIRIKGDSIRLRVTKPEINQFAETGLIEETTHIGTHQLVYQLKKSTEHNTLTAEMSGNTICVFMPDKMAAEWTSTERVGFENNMPLPNGGSLFLLLEKDFKCLDNTNEDQSDMYDNPLAEFHK